MPAVEYVKKQLVILCDADIVRIARRASLEEIK